ncbi:coiled-coil domain-containing protein 188 isoform X3 [Macrotis lagotis]|uniref:coiled-coil domain-containing protein 188 isoform X3 n=1 Tax=Macrotis lagotis TaxID=92651 RepID=UPI003D68779D
MIPGLTFMGTKRYKPGAEGAAPRHHGAKGDEAGLYPHGPPPSSAPFTDPALGEGLGCQQPLEDACPQMMDDPRTVQVPKQKLYTHEEPFTEKSQKELQHMRMSLERKKSSISEVWDGMSEVHMSLTDQAEGLLNLKKNIQDVLDEVEDIRVEILRDKAQCQNLAEKSLLIQEKKSSQPPLRVPASRSEKNQSWPEKAWTVLTKAGLCLFVGSVLFYVYIVTPNPYENLFPPLIGQRTIWRIRSWFSPFLRVEVDDFLPF